MSGQDEASACVFAPSPLLTITVERDWAGGDELHLHVGGQAYWIAHLVSELGVRVVFCATFGGESGMVLQSLLESDNLDVESVAATGANGCYVHDRRSGERTRLAQVEPSSLARHELDDLYGVTVVESLRTKVALLGGPTGDGVLPPDTYRRLAHDLRENGKCAVADLAGDPQKAALEAGVHLLKVSDEELVQDGWLDDKRDEDAVRDAIGRVAAAAGADNVVVSRAGERPTLAMIDGRLRSVHGPKFEALDHRGAGDSLTAGLVAGLARGCTIEDGLRLGSAAGGLNVTRRGLGTGRRGEIEELSHMVEIREEEA